MSNPLAIKGYINKGSIKKGEHRGTKTEFKKGMTPWNDQGNDVEYRGIHSFISRKLGKAKSCLICGSLGGKKGCHWADLTHKYIKELENFMSLCPSCYGKWDSGKLAINLFEWNKRRIII